MLNTLAIRVATYQIIVLVPTSYRQAKCHPVRPVFHIRPCTGAVSFKNPPFSYPRCFPLGDSLHPFPPPSFRPHPLLPMRQSTCTVALLRVDGRAFYERIVEPSSGRMLSHRSASPVLRLVTDRGFGACIGYPYAPAPPCPDDSSRAVMERFKVSWSVP